MEQLSTRPAVPLRRGAFFRNFFRAAWNKGSRLATNPISGCAFGNASRLGDGSNFFCAVESAPGQERQHTKALCFNSKAFQFWVKLHSNMALMGFR
jgi:hypothetical protein